MASAHCDGMGREELFLTALQIIGKYLGLISHKEIPIVNRSEYYRITNDPYSYSSNFDQLGQIGSNLVRIGSFVRSENLYSSLDILSSVIDELETECRRLTGFLNWFQQCIGNSGSFYRDKRTSDSCKRRPGSRVQQRETG